MKIAIIKPTESPEPTGGVKVQGKMWKQGLEELGHEVELIDFWKDYNWKSFDIVIILQFGGMFRTMVPLIRKLVKKLVLAPIIDTNLSHIKYKLITKYWGCQKYLGLTSRFHDMYLNRNLFDLYLARSEYEASYIERCLEIPKNRIAIVPLSIRTAFINEFPNKEDFCFHASRLAAKNKNVERLIRAAQKYKFQLILAGFLNGKIEQEWLDNLINESENIRYVGTLTNEELLQYYQRAKVFALPSIMEGVGMVALEAASNGCEIVLTDKGAPKDYFQGQAYLVNPFSIDDIGQKIQDALHNGNHQPHLMKFAQENYSMKNCSKKLAKALESCIKK